MSPFFFSMPIKKSSSLPLALSDDLDDFGDKASCLSDDLSDRSSYLSDDLSDKGSGIDSVDSRPSKWQAHGFLILGRIRG